MSCGLWQREEEGSGVCVWPQCVSNHLPVTHSCTLTHARSVLLMTQSEMSRRWGHSLQRQIGEEAVCGWQRRDCGVGSDAIWTKDHWKVKSLTSFSGQDVNYSCHTSSIITSICHFTSAHFRNLWFPRRSPVGGLIGSVRWSHDLISCSQRKRTKSQISRRLFFPLKSRVMLAERRVVSLFCHEILLLLAGERLL